MKNFKGIYAALMTPFNEDSTINFDALTKLIEHNINSGMTGLYVGGSTGESMLMSEEERVSIFEHVAKIVKGRIILIAHIGAISTDSAIRMAKKAEEFGFDAISAVAPFYYSFSMDAIKGYYTDIINSSNLPMVIYNFPNAGGFNGMIELVNSMKDNEKLIGIKHTSSNLFDIDLFKHCGKDLVVFNGFDEMLIGGLAMGADGGIGSTYNLMGKQIISIYNDFNAGNIDKAKETQSYVNRIIEKLIKYGVFQMEKEVLTCMGIPMGNCRKPFLPISEEGKKCAKEIAKELMAK